MICARGWRRVIIQRLGPSLLAGVTLAAPPHFTRHAGMAAASAAVAVGADHFLAASDEDNRLRLYSTAGGASELELDVSPWLRLSGKRGEVDLEGAATLGGLTFWLGSHGHAKDGRARPDRERFFATQWITNAQQPQLRFVGQPYRRLKEDLASAPTLQHLHLGDAALRAPEDGGINLEGLAAAPNGELLIGFRSPVPEGRALLVPLKNPREVLDGHRAKLGQPILLNLEHMGVRDMAWSGQEWFIIAGRPGAGGSEKLYRWPGGTNDPVRVEKTGFKQSHPEALALFGSAEHPRLLVLSDDGKVSRSQFRSFWVEP
jgi:hypothetical protein